MTITLPLQPQDEAKLEAIALAKGLAKGLAVDALVREALEGILAAASEIPEDATGALLVAAMQASPYKETDLGAVRTHCRSVTPCSDGMAARHQYLVHQIRNPESSHLLPVSRSTSSLLAL
jgi:hypothetical protein